MSIKVMSWVWDNSKQEGTNLLMLLAIADHANDDGICWPSIDRLAAKCRLKRRWAQAVIAKLEESGELEVQRGTGRSNTSLYLIKGASDDTLYDTGKGAVQRERVQSSVKKGAVATAPEPSVNHHIEPSVKSVAQAPQPTTHPAVLVFDELKLARPRKNLIPLIEDAGITDLDLWRDAVRSWIGSGYNPNNVTAMLEWYREPSRMNRNGNGKATPLYGAQASMDAGDRVRERLERMGLNGHGGPAQNAVRLLPQDNGGRGNVRGVFDGPG